MTKTVKEITKEDMKSLCTKYLNKEHNCMNCPLFNIEASPKPVPILGSYCGVLGSSCACGILKAKWELEEAVKRNNEELEEVENCEVEL